VGRSQSTRSGDGPAAAEATPGGPLPAAPASKHKPPAKANREAYAPIVENAFRATQVAPLSTFSADVNTASYSNTRRFLTNGHLPPRDAVFLAELVNYFPYRYPNPTGDVPVSLTLDLAPCPWKPDHHLARIGVRAKSFEPGESPRRNLVFLIDTSGSMASEERLPLVKKSFELLVHQLRADDQVSVVTYAGDSRIALRPTPGAQKETILAAINALGAGGGTNGAGGIKTAYELARASFIGNGINRVILCTDGDFNVGATSESELTQLIERERNSQVFLTVLGYGMGNLKNQTMEQLANKGNGHYAYIDSLDEARKVFVEQGAALTVVAKDVKFQVEFNPRRVTAYRLLGYENRLLKDEDFKNDKVDAGDLGSGHTVTALYELVPVGVKIELPGVDPLKYQTPGRPAGPADEWLTVKMRYKAPTGEASKEVAAVLPAGAADRPMPEDFAFAAAVAEWGLLLRDSPYKGAASYGSALKRAEASAAYDPHGHRAAFLGLLRQTIELGGRASTR
jgi:Ca-activated chloride channel family protein